MPLLAKKSKKLFLAQSSKSRPQGHWPWCHLKGHHKWSMYANNKCEVSISYDSKLIAKVKVGWWYNRQTNRQTRRKKYTPNHSNRGHNKPRSQVMVITQFMLSRSVKSSLYWLKWMRENHKHNWPKCWWCTEMTNIKPKFRILCNLPKKLQFSPCTHKKMTLQVCTVTRFEVWNLVGTIQ